MVVGDILKSRRFIHNKHNRVILEIIGNNIRYNSGKYIYTRSKEFINKNFIIITKTYSIW